MQGDFNTLCFNFQSSITDCFNQQQNLPFLVKYYLFKEIWEKIEQHKMGIDIEVRQSLIKQQQKTFDIPIQLESSDKNLNQE